MTDFVKIAGPATIAGGLILMVFDMLTIYFYYNMETHVDWSIKIWKFAGVVIPIANLINTSFTIFYGFLLTLFARMSNPSSALMAYIILDSLLLAYHLGVIIYYMVIVIDVWTTFAIQLVWCK